MEAAEIKESAKTTIYFVNGEQQETDQSKLTVRAILENAGFRPAEEYRLVRDEGNKVFAEADEELPIHKNERFTALFEGPTPAS